MICLHCTCQILLRKGLVVSLVALGAASIRVLCSPCRSASHADGNLNLKSCRLAKNFTPAHPHRTAIFTQCPLLLFLLTWPAVKAETNIFKEIAYSPGFIYHFTRATATFVLRPCRGEKVEREEGSYMVCINYMIHISLRIKLFFFCIHTSIGHNIMNTFQH